MFRAAARERAESHDITQPAMMMMMAAITGDDGYARRPPAFQRKNYPIYSPRHADAFSSAAEPIR